MSIEVHNSWMTAALNLAKKAESLGEVPVGALVIKNGIVVGQGYNLREQTQCALEHAEIAAIREASHTLGTWRLTGCSLYVTLEPCLMCAGAIYQARLDEVIFGALDPKAGAMGSLYKIHEDSRLNHRLPATQGVLGEECSAILKNFFHRLRS